MDLKLSYSSFKSILRIASFLCDVLQLATSFFIFCWRCRKDNLILALVIVTYLKVDRLENYLGELNGNIIYLLGRTEVEIGQLWLQTEMLLKSLISLLGGKRS